MALPNVTPEQRAKALEKAAQVAKRVKSLRRTLSPAKLIRLLFLRLVRTIRSSVNEG